MPNPLLIVLSGPSGVGKDAVLSKMRANGEIEAACAIDGCNGVRSPGEKCNVCGTRSSSRVICLACNTSAPVGNHFSDDEAW